MVIITISQNCCQKITRKGDVCTHVFTIYSYIFIVKNANKCTSLINFQRFVAKWICNDHLDQESSSGSPQSLLCASSNHYLDFKIITFLCLFLVFSLCMNIINTLMLSLNTTVWFHLHFEIHITVIILYVWLFSALYNMSRYFFLFIFLLKDSCFTEVCVFCQTST